MNKIQWLLSAALALALGATLLFQSGCGKKPDEPATNATATNTTAKSAADVPIGKYYCSMHPEVVQDKPGRCSKCGMNLSVKF